jgi:sulfate permease, SulP family
LDSEPLTTMPELVDVGALVALYRRSTSRLGLIYGAAARADFIAAVAAMLGVLVFDTLPGLFIGIAVSMLLLLQRASRPHIAVLGQVPGTGQWADTLHHAEDKTVSGVAVLRVESGLFFANADYVREAIAGAAADGVRAVVLDCATVPFIDVTAAGMLAEVSTSLRAEGVRLLIAHSIGQVRDILIINKTNKTKKSNKSNPEDGTNGALEFFPSVQDTVDAVGAPGSPLAGDAGKYLKSHHK